MMTLPSRHQLPLKKCMSNYFYPPLFIPLILSKISTKEYSRNALYLYSTNPVIRLLINSSILNIRSVSHESFIYTIYSVFILLNIRLLIILFQICHLIVILAIHLSPYFLAQTTFIMISFTLLVSFYSAPTRLVFSIICVFLAEFFAILLATYKFPKNTGACTTITNTSLAFEPMDSKKSEVPFISYITATPQIEMPQDDLSENKSHTQIKMVEKITQPQDKIVLSVESIETNKILSPELCWKNYFGLEWDDEDFQVYSATEFEECDVEAILVPENFNLVDEEISHCFTAYKRVDKKIKPVSTTFPEAARVRRQKPSNLLERLTPLSKRPPKFTPTSHITHERLEILNINPEKFLSEEEEKLFIQVMMNNEESLAFVDTERGTLKESYFSPYIMPTIPHIPWEYKNIPIPPGIRDKVIELLKEKMAAGVYEPSQSSY